MDFRTKLKTLWGLLCVHAYSQVPDAVRVMYSSRVMCVSRGVERQRSDAHDDDVQATRDFATLMDSRATLCNMAT